MSFRFMLWLQRWCRTHHRRFPPRASRFLLTHGFAPAAAMVAGLAGFIGLLVPAMLPMRGLLGEGYSRYFEIFEVLHVPGWLIWMTMFPYAVALCICFRWLPVGVRAIRVLSIVALVVSIPLADIVLAGFAAVLLVALGWALLPTVRSSAEGVMSWLGFGKGGETCTTSR